MGLFSHSSSKPEDSRSRETSITPPPSDMADSTAPTFHIYFSGLSMRTIHVLGPDRTTLVYSVDLRNRRPNLTFHRPDPTITDSHSHSHSNTGETVATANLPTWSNKLNITTTADMELRPSSRLRSDYAYPSTAFPNRSFRWTGKSMWMVSKSECLDQETGLAVARFVPRYAKKKVGVVEIAEGQAQLTQAQLDELIVTAVSIFYYRYLSQNTAMTSSSAAGAAAATSG